jgi:hypothetical protein
LETVITDSVTLKDIVKRAAEASQEALSAGIAGDELTTRAAVDRFRGILGELKAGEHNPQRWQELISLSQTDEELAGFLFGLRRGENFIKPWTQRYLGISDNKSLMLKEDGRDALLDAILPLAWDWKKDIIIIGGGAQEALIPHLINRGQKRCLVIASIEQPLRDSPHVHYLESTYTDADLYGYVKLFGRSLPVRVTVFKEGLPDTANGLLAKLNMQLSHAASEHKTTDTFGTLWLKQGLKNLTYIARIPSIKTLSESFIGLPAVIISPGPSLDKNIHLLSSLKGRALLIATAQAAKALQKAQVVPDIVAVADPGDIAYFLDGVDASKIDALMVGVSCNPQFYNTYGPRFKHTFCFNANTQVDRWVSELFGDTTFISSGGSISLDCLFIAMHWKCKEIILVGQDLSFADGKQYSDHSANSEARVNVPDGVGFIKYSNISEEYERQFTIRGTNSIDRLEKVIKLPGYYGGEVVTRGDYAQFHNDFEKLASIENAKPNPVRLINATEGGAYIQGFEHIPLAEAIDIYMPKEQQKIAVRISDAAQTIDPIVRSQILLKSLESIAVALEESVHFAKKCIATTKKVKKNSPSPKLLKELDRNEKELMDHIKQARFISIPNQAQIMNAVSESGNIYNMNAILDFALPLYKATVDTSAIALPLVKNNIKELTKYFDQKT